MDENVMRVLTMLQEGKISAQEAEMLIAALRGETAAADPVEAESAATAAAKEADKGLFGGLDPGRLKGLKGLKDELGNLGEQISKAVSKVQPEKIVKRVQNQIRTATKAGTYWGSTVSMKMRNWSNEEDARPHNPGDLPEHTDTHDQEFHLEPGAKVLIENPLGDVKIVGISDGPTSVVVRKLAWSTRPEDAKAVAARMETSLTGTDSRLDVKVSAPDGFRDGVVDLEVRLPKNVGNVRVNAHFGQVEVSAIDGLVEVVTTTGELLLSDLGGDARAETVSGDLKVSKIAGAATVATQSGDITAEGVYRGLSANTASGDVKASDIEGGRVECKSVSGDSTLERAGLQSPVDIAVESISGDATLKDANGSVNLKAVSGDVLAEGLTATRLQAQTVSGDVTLRLREAFSSTMQVNTVSGDVTVSLPEGSNVRVSLSTSSGELRCEHDAQDVTATETLWTGQIGTGAGTLNVQTISGDSHIQRA